MAVPKRKHSNARTGARRAHDFKRPVQTAPCAECNKMIPTHVVCPNCGSYMGRQVVSQEQDK
ncbi:MAG: 50S ribosomal protein L32 [Thermoguttaceae bacterium]|jgi:large subunit ribosomal protein L32|nr:50S ribosomal protein L32 [Thermoguttaceae bacterium]